MFSGENTDPDELPPYDGSAEAGCIACILSAEDRSAREWIALLSKEHFYDVRHQEVFTALRCLNGSAINIISLSQWLTDKNRMEDAGGFAYVSALPEQSPSPTLWESYFEPLENCRVRRSVLRDSAELSLIARNRAIDLPVLSDAARRMSLSYSVNANLKRLTTRNASEISSMQFDDSDRILGDRLLAKGQPLVIAGAGALGKSRLAFQLAVCVITRRPFIGFETRGDSLRWLILQAENSNRRLQTDLNNLRDWISPEDWNKVNEQLFIHTLETDIDSLLSLGSEKNQERIAATIAAINPDIILYDSLYNFGIGDLNSDEGMTDTLQAIARISRKDKPDRSIITLHHAITGKAGAAKATGYDRASFARNSKVLHSWTRGQINLAPGSPDDTNLLVVSCGKCSNGQEFKPFGIRLDPVSMIYTEDTTFNVEAWQSELSGKPGPIPVSEIAALCFPPISKAELAQRCRDEFGVTRESAYRLIRRAEQRKAIFKNPQTDLFSPSS